MGVALNAQHVPAASIVIERDSPPAVSFAASELRRYLSIITGGRFPVGEEVADEQAPAIRLSVSPSRRKPGSYGWSVREGEIAISGDEPGAVLHAVYALLEELGCVWLHHWEGGEIVPLIPEVTVPFGERIHEPVFTHREFTNILPITDEFPLMIDWMAKNRFNRFMVFANVAGSVETYLDRLEPEVLARGMSATMGHHSFRYFLPPDEFFADHPDYFALLDGQRSRDGQLCTSNPAVVEAMAERVCGFFSDHPGIEMIGLWPNDGHGWWCQCEACLALEPQRPAFWGDDSVRRTDTYLRFVNEIAEIVAQEHPDRRLSALAYHNYVEAPAVCFAPMLRCIKHPIAPGEHCDRRNEAYARMIEQWRPLVRNDLYLFCYLMQIDMHSLPYPIAHMLPDNWRWMAGAGVDGYVMEFVPEEWGAFGQSAHAIGRLSWDTEMDFDAWLAEHDGHVFGPAAAEIGELRDRLTHDLALPGPCTGHYDLSYTARATDELMRPALEALGTARTLAATGEKQHWRAVQKTWVGVELLMRVGQWQRLTRDGLEARASQAAAETLEWARGQADSGALAIGRLERALGPASRGE